MLRAFNWINHLYHEHHVAKTSADMSSHKIKAFEHDLAQLKGVGFIEELKNKLAEAEGKISEVEGKKAILAEEVTKLKVNVAVKDERIIVAKREFEENTRLKDEMKKSYPSFDHFHRFLMRALPDFDDKTN